MESQPHILEEKDTFLFGIEVDPNMVHGGPEKIYHLSISICLLGCTYDDDYFFMSLLITWIHPA